jgi:superfamily II DNA or RNA helicase
MARHMTSHAVVGERLGDIVLRAHQRRAADRLVRVLESHGGALLAEPVGVGKTYTALAVAMHFASTTLVVAPAALREMWGDAASRCDLPIVFASHESLSRGTLPQADVDFVIVDEAHRVRSPDTRRYSHLASLARRVRMLLVTATPVHNRREDLAAQLALFLGRSAWHLSDEALTEYVVKSSELLADTRPDLDGPHRITLDTTDDCLDRLLALPDPIPAHDESAAAALLKYGLLHQWASSRAALVAALRRRRARGLALADILESGRRPTRSDLAAWTQGDDALQLAFPEIVTTGPKDLDVGDLLVAVDRHNASVDAVLRFLRTTPDPDVARASALVQLRGRHAGARIIAFSQYAETVAAMWRHLSHERGVAMLTAKGARVASGSISRRAAIDQFTPNQLGSAHAPDRERIELLITTDLLSEGLNLQEASVIVHLDLPWNPARLDQRVGRALRHGSRHEKVTVYLIAPPAAADHLLRIETRLRDKLDVAHRSLGIAGRILPNAFMEAPRPRGLAEQRGAVDATLRGWLSDFGSPPDGCHIAAIAVQTPGFLAVVRDSNGPSFVADVGSGATTSLESIVSAIDLCANGVQATIEPASAEAALQSLTRWMSARRAAETVNLGAVAADRARRTTLARVAQTLARTPRHRRSNLAPLAAAARAVATSPLGEGAERVLETLASAALPDEAWLRSIATFGELNIRQFQPLEARAPVSGVLALIVFAPMHL